MKLLSNGEARRGVRQPNTTVSSSIASSVGSTSSGSLPTTTVALANPAHTLIGLTDLRNTPRYSDLDGSGLTIAVLDTGIDATHPQLSGNFIGFIDFTDPNVAAETASLITNPALTYDYDLHGTHVAGTAASTDPTVGVATGSDLISLAVLGPNGGSSS